LVYQHFPFERRDRFIERISNELRDRLTRGTVRAFRTPYLALFMVAQPDHKRLLKASLEKLTHLKIFNVTDTT
jgi:hypothetical protein